MSISYPLSLPSGHRDARDIELEVVPIVGVSRSPFTGAQQTYGWPNEYWMATFNLVPMLRADAEEWVSAFLLALNGMEGSFLMGQAGYTTPRGSWSGQSPLCAGAGTALAKTLAIDGLSNGSTVRAGDLFQLGSGSSSRLYKITKDATANGSGQVTLDFTPRLRSAPADNAALTLASPKGLFMLTPESRSRWNIGQAMAYGLQFSAMEDLRGL